MAAEESINWAVFRKYWRVSFGRYLWIIATPWFSMALSSGAEDWSLGYPFCLWYGLRAYWKHPKNWQIGEGELLFRACDLTLSFVGNMQREDYRHAA